jgi:hypothetical protein
MGEVHIEYSLCWCCGGFFCVDYPFTTDIAAEFKIATKRCTQIGPGHIDIMAPVVFVHIFRVNRLKGGSFDCLETGSQITHVLQRIHANRHSHNTVMVCDTRPAEAAADQKSVIVQTRMRVEMRVRAWYRVEQQWWVRIRTVAIGGRLGGTRSTET